MTLIRSALRPAVAAAGLVLALSGPAAAAQRALVVGINDYPQLPEANQLLGAANDVDSMVGLMTAVFGMAPGDIRVLKNREATRAAILAAFEEWLVDGTRAGDRVLFYFSGHGTQVPDQNGDEVDDRKDEALVASDGRLDGSEGMILDDEIAELVGRLAGRDVTIVIDSCHSGTVTRSLEPSTVPGSRGILLTAEAAAAPPTAQSVAAARQETGLVSGGATVRVWTAVSPIQLALEDQRATPVQGVFTRSFIRGLRDRQADQNGDGVISHSELHGFLQRESEEYCNRLLYDCRLGLTPTLDAPAAALLQPVAAPPPGSPANPPGPGPAAGAAPALQTQAAGALGHDNAARVEIDILPGSRVRVGQQVQFRVTSAASGRLVLLDVNANGEMIQIFPNQFAERWNRTGALDANRPLTVPDPTYGFAFTASEPAGSGLLIALVIEDAVPLSDLLDLNRSFDPVSQPSEYLAQLAQRLRRPWTGERTDRRVRWSMASRPYLIER